MRITRVLVPAEVRKWHWIHACSHFLSLPPCFASCSAECLTLSPKRAPCPCSVNSAASFPHLSLWCLLVPSLPFCTGNHLSDWETVIIP